MGVEARVMGVEVRVMEAEVRVMVMVMVDRKAVLQENKWTRRNMLCA
jgi:hypothetical protein